MQNPQQCIIERMHTHHLLCIGTWCTSPAEGPSLKNMSYLPSSLSWRLKKVCDASCINVSLLVFSMWDIIQFSILAVMILTDPHNHSLPKNSGHLTQSYRVHFTNNAQQSSLTRLRILPIVLTSLSPQKWEFQVGTWT